MSAQHDRLMKALVLTETAEPTSRIKDADTPAPFRLPDLAELRKRYGPPAGQEPEFGTARRPTMTEQRMTEKTLTEAQRTTARETLRAALTGAETPTTLTEAKAREWYDRLRGTAPAVPADAHARMRKALA